MKFFVFLTLVLFFGAVVRKAIRRKRQMPLLVEIAQGHRNDAVPGEPMPKRKVQGRSSRKRKHKRRSRRRR